MTKKLLITLFFGLIVAGCGQEVKETSPAPADVRTETEKASTPITNVSAAEAEAVISKGGVQFIDVRSAAEYKEGHAKAALNKPLETLANSLDGLKKDEPVYVICRTGSRSTMASELLKEKGFTKIYNINGGTAEWDAANLPMEPAAE